AHVAEQERAVMVGFAERLRAEGIPVREISVGSTPAMTAAEQLDGVTEARPGNYVFYDRTMVLIGCCAPEDVGVTVLASVVSHQPGASHFIVDAGALALSKDAGPAHVGPPAMGAVKGHPELSVATLLQEHGLIRAEGGAPRAAPPPRRVVDWVGRGRARSLRLIRLPDATALAASRARGAADLQDPSRLRDRDARRDRLAAHEPRGPHPSPTAPPD